jgi:hypothetical protein
VTNYQHCHDGTPHPVEGTFGEFTMITCANVPVSGHPWPVLDGAALQE